MGKWKCEQKRVRWKGRRGCGSWIKGLGELIGNYSPASKSSSLSNDTSFHPRYSDRRLTDRTFRSFVPVFELGSVTARSAYTPLLPFFSYWWQPGLGIVTFGTYHCSAFHPTESISNVSLPILILFLIPPLCISSHWEHFICISSSLNGASHPIAVEFIWLGVTPLISSISFYIEHFVSSHFL